jgi:hypothetical protein
MLKYQDTSITVRTNVGFRLMSISQEQNRIRIILSSHTRLKIAKNYKARVSGHVVRMTPVTNS